MALHAIDRFEAGTFELERLEPRVLLSTAWVFEAWEEILPAGADFDDFSDIGYAWDLSAFWDLKSYTVFLGGQADNWELRGEGWLAIGDKLLTTDDTPWLVDSQIHDVRGDTALARQLILNGGSITVGDWMFLDLRTGERDFFLDGVALDPLFDPDPEPSSRHISHTRPIMMGQDAVVFRRPTPDHTVETPRVWLARDDALVLLYEGEAYDVTDSGYVVGQQEGGDPLIAEETDVGAAWHADSGLVTFPGTWSITEGNDDGVALGLVREQVGVGFPTYSVVLFDLMNGAAEVIAGEGASGRISIPDHNTYVGVDVSEDGSLFIRGSDPTPFGDRSELYIIKPGGTESVSIGPRIFGEPDTSTTLLGSRFDNAHHLYNESGWYVEIPLEDALRTLGPIATGYNNGPVVFAPGVSNELLYFFGLRSQPHVQGAWSFNASGEFDVALAEAPLWPTEPNQFAAVIMDGVGSIRTMSGSLAIPAAFGNAVGGDEFTRSPFGFTGNDHRAHLGGITPDGEVMLYYQTRSDSGLLYGVNLSTDHLEPQGLATPGFVGQLVGYSTPWNGMNIAGLNAQGEVEIVWWAPGIGDLWTTTNISKEIGAPKLVGNISAVATPWETINIVGTDADGTAWMLHWSPSFGAGNWNVTNLTEAALGAVLKAGSLTAHVTGWGGLVFTGIEQDTGRVVSYWWEATIDRWVYEVLAPDEAAPVGALSSAASATEQSIVGVAEDGSLLRYWSTFDSGWQVDNLSELAVI